MRKLGARLHDSLSRVCKAFVPYSQRRGGGIREATAQLAQERIALLENAVEVGPFGAEPRPGRVDDVVEEITAQRW